MGGNHSKNRERTQRDVPNNSFVSEERLYPVIQEDCCVVEKTVEVKERDPTKYHRYYEVDTHLPVVSNILEKGCGWDGRVFCEHTMTGCTYWLECCQKWFPCRLCHRFKCPGEKIDNYLSDNGLLLGARVKCLSCLMEQYFGDGYCMKCERPFGEKICVPCEIATDYLNGQHCYNCGFCAAKEKVQHHCLKCRDCFCPSQDGKKFNCLPHGNECAICMELLLKTCRWRGRSTISKCGHTFHEDCLAEWMGTSKTCPLCRCEFMEDDIMKCMSWAKELKRPVIYYKRESVTAIDSYYGKHGVIDCGVELINPSAPSILDNVLFPDNMPQPSAPPMQVL